MNDGITEQARLQALELARQALEKMPKAGMPHADTRIRMLIGLLEMPRQWTYRAARETQETAE